MSILFYELKELIIIPKVLYEQNEMSLSFYELYKELIIIPKVLYKQNEMSLSFYDYSEGSIEFNVDVEPWTS
jgi:hypothetical protein